MEICKRCKLAGKCSASSESDFCLNYEPRPQTNYDRLVSKTQEDLAKWMVWYGNDGITCKFKDFDILECGYGPEYDSAIDWLNAPAEDVPHEE